MTYLIGADDRQRLIKRVIRVVMVKTEPTLLYLFGQAAQAFVDRTPIAEMFQTRRTTFFECLIQHKPSLIIDVMVEVDVCTDHCIAHQEPSRLGKPVLVRLGINQHNMGGQRRLQQALGGILAQTCCLGYLLLRQSFFVLVQQVQDTVLDKQPAHLEDHRSPRVQVRHLLRLLRVVWLLAEYAF